MQTLELAREAQLHREAYIAILHGLLSQPGDKRRLAERVGITPQYLSYLLAPFDRTPSPTLARKIASALPIGQDARDRLLEHLMLANEQRVKLQAVPKECWHPCDAQGVFAQLRTAREKAIFAADPKRARAQYQSVHQAGRMLAGSLDPSDDPLLFAELCLWLSDVENILNFPGDALYFARKAYYVLAAYTRADFTVEDRLRFDVLECEALRAEAVAYHNLKLPRQGYDRCCAAENTRLIRHQPAAWLPHLYRDKINALGKQPRFSIREAERLAAQGKSLCEQSAHPQCSLWALMLDRSLAEAYIRYGNLKKANRLLTAQYESLPDQPIIGPLHRVLLLSSYAQVHWQEGDRESWRFILSAALETACAAGLTHQVAKIRRRYGDAIKPLLTETTPC